MPATLMRDGNAGVMLKQLINGKIDFELTCSNYTTKIKSDVITKTFLATMQDKKTFAAFSKIKADLKGKRVPKVNPERLVYFQHDFKQPLYVERVCNIDIKSAYARVLLNDGMITQETFDYLSKCTKQQRLASVGMIASRKQIFDFKEGEPFSHREIISDLAGFFFYAVKRTHEIMSDLKKICGQDYLFTWVDGIYFLPNEETVLKIDEYLQGKKFNYSREELTEFEVKIFPRKVGLTFKKEGKQKGFNLPTVSSVFKRITVDAIMLVNKQYEYEKSKSQNSGKHGK